VAIFQTERSTKLKARAGRLNLGDYVIVCKHRIDEYGDVCQIQSQFNLTWNCLFWTCRILVVSRGQTAFFSFRLVTRKKGSGYPSIEILVRWNCQKLASVNEALTSRKRRVDN